MARHLLSPVVPVSPLFSMSSLFLRPPPSGWCGWPARAGLAWAVAVGGGMALTLPPSAGAQALDTSGELRATWAHRSPASTGPLAQANAWLPGVAPAEPMAGTVQAELRAATRLGAGTAGEGVRLATTATLQSQSPEGGAGHTTAWVNEATASGAAGGWQWSVGKKVVSWDVGYAFRPNDVVQQETRRGLAPNTLVGRPVLMAEHFTANTAWSWVAVNPGRSGALPAWGLLPLANPPPSTTTAGHEPALAARVYHQAGEVDWHGFARWGTRTRGSVGLAASWVASDALELHASVRQLSRFDTLAPAATATAVAGTSPASPALPATALLAANPWQPALGGSASQWLVGGTWTNEHQLSLLAEAWYDGTALSPAQWRQWSARNQALPAWAAMGAPAAAVAGNLAWQASAFSANAAGNLHRQNALARLSWTHGAWQPALDVLWHPADGGRLLTASLVWQGDRTKVEGGWRVTGGPSTAVLRQLPVQKQAYLMGTWAF